MSDDKLTHKSTDKSVSDVFDKMAIPPANSNSKKQAMNLAMAEFAQYQQEKKITQENKSQGFWSFLRLTSDKSSEEREPEMKEPKTKEPEIKEPVMGFLHNKLFYSGAATLSVAVIGVLLFNPSQHSSIDEQMPIPLVLNESGKLDSFEKKVLVQKMEALALGDSVAASPILESAAEVSSMSSASQVRTQEKRDASSVAIKAKKYRLAEAERKRAKNSSQVYGDSRAMPQVKQQSPLQFQLQSGEPLPAPISVQVGNDNFEQVDSHGVTQAIKEPVSTFSIDVDTASYSFVRRQLNQGVLPQKDAVRLEELINYFDYHYPLPESKKQPFQPTVVVHPSPWAAGKQLLHIGIKGYDIEAAKTPSSNIVLLLDVSGSMHGADRLPLVKQSMQMLLNSLQPDDTVAIVVYAGAAGQVLEPTPVKQKQKILAALDRIRAGGSTAGGEGIKLAYSLAEANFNKNAVNRIILATDGDFNVGINDHDELKGFVERKRQQGIFLSVLGFGQGNYNDHLMQTLAQNGNGIAAYIDSLSEAQKVLVDEATSTLFPIAKDVKIQVEFNPSQVAEYRLLGYETRELAQEDFSNDKVDAGDIGAGHSVTAIYEITLTDSSATQIDTPRYSANNSVNQTKNTNDEVNDELAFLKIRYKLPKATTSTLITHKVTRSEAKQKAISLATQRDVNFATAVAAFGQLLKGGKYTNNYTYDDIINLAQANKGDDEYGYRTEFIQLVRKAIVASAL
ncbi:MAG: Ca-activated chloride channel family protein [Candidatus Endobugula sp.]|jgi:Ca-activated chloride channel family protein